MPDNPCIIPNIAVGRMPKFIQSLNKYLLAMCQGRVRALGWRREGKERL